MKIVLYRDSAVIEIHKNVEGLKITENKIIWKDGSLEGLGENVEFLIIPDDVEIKVGDFLDESNTFSKLDNTLFEEVDKVMLLVNMTDMMQQIDDFTLIKVIEQEEKSLTLEERIANIEARLNAGGL